MLGRNIKYLVEGYGWDARHVGSNNIKYIEMVDVLGVLRESSV